MLTSKQRAYLKGLANTIDPIFQIGKGGIIDTQIEQFNEALRARELIKIKVLENSECSAKDAAIEISEKTQAEVVQVIGSKFVLYKPNPKKPVIVLKK